MSESDFHDRAVTWLRIENCPDVFNNERDYGYEETLSWLIEVQKDATKNLQSQLTSAREEIAAGDQISGSFFEALKPLNLKEVYVQNPGQHITDLIKELSEARAEVETIARLHNKAERAIQNALADAELRADNAEKLVGVLRKALKKINGLRGSSYDAHGNEMHRVISSEALSLTTQTQEKK